MSRFSRIFFLMIMNKDTTRKIFLDYFICKEETSCEKWSEYADPAKFSQMDEQHLPLFLKNGRMSGKIAS